MGTKKKTTSGPYQIRISQNALNNIDEITGYIAFNKQEPLSAILVGDALFNAIERIGNNPFAYRECEALITKSKMYRRAVCYTWNVIFKISGLEIIILRVIHSSRKPSSFKSLRGIK